MPDETLFGESEGPETGKSLASLKKSQDKRAALIALFGGVQNLPSSIMRAERMRTDPDIDLPSAERSYTNTDPKGDKLRKRKLEERLVGGVEVGKLKGHFDISSRGCQSGALSIYPRNIGKALILLYSEPGDLIIDPFAGHASRINLAVECGRGYIGCDLSHDFMDFNRKRAAELKERNPKLRIEVHECDSRKMPVDSEIGNFGITSPPYGSIEFYGDEPEQLGKCATYEDFLDSLGIIMKEHYRTLKPGAFCVWSINDYRDHGIFRSYHSDVIELGKKAGFVPWDMIITDFGRGFRDCFIAMTVAQRIVGKRHEYNVIMRKPGWEDKEKRD